MRDSRLKLSRYNSHTGRTEQGRAPLVYLHSYSTLSLWLVLPATDLRPLVMMTTYCNCNVMLFKVMVDIVS